MRANVRSIQALLDLKGDLARFAAESRASLQQLGRELRRTTEWLEGRRRHWEGQVRRARQQVDQARAALLQCQAAADETRRTGRRYVPDCSPYAAALRKAQAQLQECEAQLANAEHWLRTVQKAGATYQRQARRMMHFTETELVEAQAYLERSASILRAYAAGDLSGGLPLITTPPSEFATITYADAVMLGALGLTGVALHVISKMAGPIRQTLGNVGEQLVSQLLADQPGWQELAFDQPKHGFDRVFTAPGMPVIVVESKVHHKGEFHPGQTQAGEQGSPEWIAAQTEKMADPNSAQWSPANQRIASLIREIGPENVPVLAVVVETDTGRVAVHYRAPGNAAWRELAAGMSLEKALTVSSNETPQEEETDAGQE